MAKENEKNDKLKAMRHSCEHVLTMAMLRLYPKLKPAMGPATDEGFYFDFEFDRPILTKEFKKIEAEMHKIIKENLPIVKEVMTVKEARKFFSKGTYHGNKYKHEWIDEIEKRKEKVSVYRMGQKGQDMPTTFVDICSGPHMKSTKEIGPFKLLSLAGAYWRGSEKNKMLQRIYGTCFSTPKELEDYLHMQEEAKARDHRELGKRLDLFTFSDLVGKGLPMLTPKGTIIRRILEKFIIEEETNRGYQHVITPPLAKTALYKKSGHYPYYKDTMYPVMKVDEDELILRPMTCPHHFMLYNSKPRSYKELPLRIAELSPQFRYEKSGELTGLMRVRMFCLADAHIICTEEQAKSEIKDVLKLIDFANKKLGFVKDKDYRYRLSLGDRTDDKKYYKNDTAWDKAEKILRNVLIETKAPFFEAQGEASFYGPKIDIQMKKVNGQEETVFTVQYDFVMPERFDMKYTDRDGAEKQPIVIHRSSIGAFERTMAFLIEHYAGAFPVWLSPVQVKILTISPKQIKYAEKVEKELKDNNIRAELDNSEETIGRKIRNSEVEKVPYILIIGDKEVKSNKVAVRVRGKGDKGAIKLDKFIEDIQEEIERKK